MGAGLTRTVRLLRPHRQAGKLYAVGTRLRMSDELARWLISQAIAVADGTALPAEAKAAPPPPRRCCGR